jgi:GlpG protein
MNIWNIASWCIGIKRNPIVALLMLSSLVGSGIVEISPSLTNTLFFAHPDTGQYLRMISPIFLHFGLLHLVFNCLWLGLLGSKLKPIWVQFIC